MEEDKEKLDKFGQFLMENLRDSAILHIENLLAGKWKSPSLQELQAKLSELSDEQKKLILACIIQSVDNGIHNFLFELQDYDPIQSAEIKITVDDVNIEPLSQGLHGEIFGAEGWRAKYSKYSETNSV